MVKVWLASLYSRITILSDIKFKEIDVRHSLLITVLLLLAVLTTAACGQKGSLYLPDEPATKVQDKDKDNDKAPAQ